MKKITNSEKYINRILNRPLQKIWWSIGTHLWVDLGDFRVKRTYEVHGKKRTYSLYEFIIHLTRYWKILEKKRTILDIKTSNDQEISDTLEELSTRKLNLIDISLEESGGYFKFNNDIEITFEKSQENTEEFEFQFYDLRKSLELRNNKWFLVDYDEVV